MDATIMNKDFRITRVIDSFTSFIWNDVYIGYGDFELEFVMDGNGLAYIEEGYYVSIAKSDRIMIIESIELLTSFQEGIKARISGRSLECVLERRIIRNKINFSNTNLQSAITRMISENLSNASKENRNIEGFAMRLSTEKLITDQTITAEYEAGANLYKTICDICEERNLGFRVVTHNERFFLFELYCGEDRSYDQAKNPWVVFSPQFENIEESDMTIDTSNHKNVVEIDAQITVVGAGTDADGNPIDLVYTVSMALNDDIKGLDRRELYKSVSVSVSGTNKAAFGKASDMVNQYEYMSYQLLEFDSQGYRKAYSDYMAKYSSHIAAASQPQVVRVEWRDSSGNLNYYKDPNTGQLTFPSGGSSSSKSNDPSASEAGPMAIDIFDEAGVSKTRAASVSNGISTQDMSKEEFDNTKPGWLETGNSSSDFDNNKPSWLDNHRVEVLETPAEAAQRAAGYISRIEAGAPSRSEFERWGWAFTDGTSRNEYNAAVAAKQAEIDAAWQKALNDSIAYAKLLAAQQAAEDLSPYLQITSFTGKVDPNINFVYGRDYFLGDQVQIVNEYKFNAKTRVVGILFSHDDRDGEIARPTFASDNKAEVEFDLNDI